MPSRMISRMETKGTGKGNICEFLILERKSKRRCNDEIKDVYMKNFEMLQKVCIDEVLGAGIEPGNIVSWVINHRAKTRWGMCTKNPDGTCIIQIAARLIEDERIPEQACKETMIHEILHTCKGCKGHTGLWLVYANIMNKKYGYNIKRTTSGEEKGVENYTASKRLDYKYCFVCENCGQIIKRKKQCEFTKYYRNYTCGICGRKRAFHKVKYMQ